mgnify:CR=1 FL=1
MNEIVNRVANSPIVTIDLDNFYIQGSRFGFDLKGFLVQGLILKEAEFRAALLKIDWEQFKGGYVAIFCSADAIVPNWAFMLVGTYLGKIGVEYVIGDLESLEQYLFEKQLSGLRVEDYVGRPVVVKGCSKYQVPLYALGRVLAFVQPVAKSVMYGEPCSTVPLYKAKP